MVVDNFPENLSKFFKSSSVNSYGHAETTEEIYVESTFCGTFFAC